MKLHWSIIIIIYFASGSFIQCNQQIKLTPEISDNGGLFLPANFEAQVIVDSIDEKARHITVAENGAVYVNLRYSKKGKAIGILQDTTFDGKADIIEKFGSDTKGPYGKKSSYATAIRIYKGYLYVSSELVIYRYKLKDGSLIPEIEPEIILTDDHEHGIHHHIGKPITFDDKGFMYVPFGGPSNACQEIERTPRSMGYDPCPQLEDHGGIWRFDPNKIEQTQKDGYKFATGIRSVIALDWNHDDGNLYAVVHGRDDLMRIFPGKYSAWESAMLPAEQFIKITEGSDFGWPYCYYDQLQEKMVLAPEYGGDGEIIGRCDQFEDPILGFPGHWAPNDLVFYTGDQFPERYKNGAFIAFHGSSNRAPYPQSGYFVAFSPFKNGQSTGEWEVFADGFAQVDPIVSVKDAVYRPMGLSVGPNGSLFMADTEEGKVWKVNYVGDKNDFGKEHLAAMEERKQLTHIRTPHEIEDNLKSIAGISEGEKMYYAHCSQCHQEDGQGTGGRFPSLAGTDWVQGDKSRLIKVVLEGLEGAIEINGESFSGLMPGHSFLSDKEIAKILTYIRSNFGNDAGAVKAKEVQQVRKSLK